MISRIRQVIFPLLAVALLALPPTGCANPSANTPPAALAPGYNSPADQQLGQALAALRAGAAAAKTNYATLTPSQQATIRGPLNAFIDAVDLADPLYLAYHLGVTPSDPNPPTQAQVQSAVTKAQNQQTAYFAAGGVKP